MTKNEISMFNDSCGEPIVKEPKGHKLNLNYFKTVHGFRAVCECGVKIGSAGGSATNRAGYAHDRLYIKQAYNKHIKELP